MKRDIGEGIFLFLHYYPKVCRIKPGNHFYRELTFEKKSVFDESDKDLKFKGHWCESDKPLYFLKLCLHRVGEGRRHILEFLSKE